MRDLLKGGKYDHECGVVRNLTKAEVVLLVVVGGTKGNGFQVHCTEQNIHVLNALPDLLEDIAGNIRKQLTADGN